MTLAVSSAACFLACLVVSLLPVGCGGDETALLPHDAGPTDCAPGERLIDGKGCLAAGIQDNGCPAGTLGLDDGACQPAGIPPELCGEGFEPDGNMGCNAILPAAPCPKGLMAVPGETTCREVAPCGAGTWGDIPVEANTEYVDAGYAGADSDGTAAKPWKSIQPGVGAAAPGAIVAVAAGSYAEDVLIEGKPVRLWGRCPKLVEIVGTGAEVAAVFFKTGASGAEVRGVAVRGAAIGLFLSGSDTVLMDRVWIHDAGSAGLVVQDDFGTTSVELTRSLVEGNRVVGVFVAGSDATVKATAVRDTRVQASDEQFGWGIGIQDGPDTGERASVTVCASVVEANREAGVNVYGSDATIEATVVRDTQPRASDQKYGRGIGIADDPDTGERASATVRASVVEANRDVGVFVFASDATIESTVVRGTQPRVSDGRLGGGIGIHDGLVTGERASVTVRASVVEDNRDVGVAVVGSDATIESTVVRGTQPQASDQQHGLGIVIQYDADTSERASVTMHASVVDGNRELGVAVVGSDATIESTVVRDTQPQASDGRFGDGVIVDAATDFGAFATLTACLVAGSARAGVSSFGGTVGLAQTRLDCNVFHLAGENPYPGFSFSFDELGGNACGCGNDAVACQVASPGLEPPEPLPPLE